MVGDGAQRGLEMAVVLVVLGCKKWYEQSSGDWQPVQPHEPPDDVQRLTPDFPLFLPDNKAEAFRGPARHCAVHLGLARLTHKSPLPKNNAGANDIRKTALSHERPELHFAQSQLPQEQARQALRVQRHWLAQTPTSLSTQALSANLSRLVRTRA